MRFLESHDIQKTRELQAGSLPNEAMAVGIARTISTTVGAH